MAHPLELCPTGRDCVACPHPGAFWAPVRLLTGVLGVKGVLEASARSPRHKGEARSEQRDAFVMLFPGMAGTLPFLPQLSPHPASPSSDFAPVEATFSAQSGQSSCLLHCLSQTLHLMSSPGLACERLIGGAVFPEPRTITGPAGRGGPGAVRLPSGGRGGWHSVPSPGRSLGMDTQDSVPRPRAQAREGWNSCLTQSQGALEKWWAERLPSWGKGRATPSKQGTWKGSSLTLRNRYSKTWQRSET